MAEGLEGKTKEHLEKQGFKFASSKDYMYKMIKGKYEFYKIDEKGLLYFPINSNPNHERNRVDFI